MTTWGHGLTGIAFGVLAVPRSWTRAKQAGLLLLFVGLAVVPDWPLPFWGHDRYSVSHSLFVNLGLIGMCVAAYAFAPGARRFLGGWRTAGLGVAAWLSHFLLDSFYNHGRGVGIFWPLSEAHLALPMPWFRTLPHGWALGTAEFWRIIAIETVFYGAVVLVCFGLRWWWERRRA